MTTKEKLLEEFECAIEAVLGDSAEKEFNEAEIDAETVLQIAKKVGFYLDL